MNLGNVDPAVCLDCGAHPSRCEGLHPLLGAASPELLTWRIARTWQEEQTEAERMFFDALNQYAARQLRLAADEVSDACYGLAAMELRRRADDLDRRHR